MALSRRFAFWPVVSSEVKTLSPRFAADAPATTLTFGLPPVGTAYLKKCDRFIDCGKYDRCVGSVVKHGDPAAIRLEHQASSRIKRNVGWPGGRRPQDAVRNPLAAFELVE